MGKKDRSQNSGADADAKHEQCLQAVLLADSFTTNFRPLSLDKAKCLCPLNNVTLLDYAMEFLAGAGVEELFVVCVRDEVEEYIKQHTWSGSMQVTCVKDSSITNAGDALRELDRRNLVQSDPFILMNGDVVTNVDILPVLKAHEERHKKDSTAMMTLLFKSVGSWDVKHDGSAVYSPLRSADEDLVVALDPSQSNRIMLYDDYSRKSHVDLPCSFFMAHPQADLRSDLLDSGIYICSPDVLARFSDAFDYLDIKLFVEDSVAEEEEGLQNKIYAHLLGPSEYAARIHDFSSYAAISKDLLRRWCYPVVPDNLPSGYEKTYRYGLQRHYHYREMKMGQTKIARSSTLQGPGMVGSQCHVGDKCEIKGTVIGNNCNIGSGVVLRDCHLWENVTVEEGATVLESILGNDCVVKAGATVSRGCIIGPGCVVGSGVVLPEFTRITLSADNQNDDDDDSGFGDFDSSSSEEGSSSDEESDEDSEEENTTTEEKSSNANPPGAEGRATVVSDHDVVGPDGLGRVWIPSSGDDSDSDEDSVDDEKENAFDPIEVESIGYDATQLYKRRMEIQKEDDDLLSDNEDQHDMDFDAYDQDDGGVDFGGMSSMNAQAPIIGRQKGVDVVKELKAICDEHETSSPVENLAIELNSFKFSQNATYSDCTMAATLTILGKMEITSSMSAGKLVSSLKGLLSHWAPLLQRMSIGLDEEKSIIGALEKAALDGGEKGDTLSKEPAFRYMLQTLYDDGDGVVSEEAIMSWAADRNNEDAESPRVKLFKQEKTQEFLEWLQEESDDDSDEDSSSSGSDDED
mmetsp:Transcript_12603/g.19532  ORF Transcript_12603/g.19532 Transcript_12603/m.19532 type:complete len:802 (-) Transcript_12603:3-2408(-)